MNSIQYFLSQVSTLNVFDFKVYNPCVLTKFLELVAKYKVDLEDACYLEHATKVDIGGYDVFVNENESLFLDEFMILPKFPVTLAQLVDAVPSITKHTSFVPVPFTTLDSTHESYNPDYLKYVVLADFDMVKIMPTWDDYLASLTGRRRYDLRRAMKQAVTLTKVLWSDPVGQHIEDAVSWLRERFENNDAEFAVAQFLMGYALYRNYPFHFDMFILSKEGRKAAIGFVERVNTEHVVSHSYAFCPSESNIGSAFVGNVVKYYTDTQAAKTFNVGLGAQQEDTGYITYSKCVCNAQQTSICLASAKGHDEFSKPYFANGKWEL